MSFYNDDIKILDKKDYPKKEAKPSKVYESIKDLFYKLDLKDGITVSSHHHLRNGDAVLNMMMLELQRRGIKDITLVASSLFPVHKELIPLLEDGTITNIITSYISGDLAKAISKGKLKGKILMQSHGGRARSIIDKNVVIDYAFIAAPSCDPMGNISGVNGEASCGSMGYAMADDLR